MNTENKPAWPQGYNPKGKRRSKAEVRAHNLQVWLTDETLKARIVSAAKADGRTMANWINSKICPIIDAVVDAALAGKNLNDAKVAELFIKNATEAQRAKKLMGADRNGRNIPEVLQSITAKAKARAVAKEARRVRAAKRPQQG